MGRADLIGPGKHHLIPNWQPVGTGLTGGEGVRQGRKHGLQTFTTKGVPLLAQPGAGVKGAPVRGEGRNRPTAGAAASKGKPTGPGKGRR